MSRRIGVAFAGDPSNPRTWSGTPYGVLTGLRETGVDPVPICAEPAPLVRALTLNALTVAHLRPGRSLRAVARRGRAAALASPGLATVNSWAAPRALRDAGPLAGIVQIGCGYTLDTDVPIVTLEDMTVAQTRANGQAYAGWDALSARAWRSRLERQRRAYERAAACCVTTRWAADSVLADYDIAPQKVHVVGIGRNHDAPPVGARDWSTPRFLFIGIDWKRKNGAGVLRAFAQLQAELSRARLDVVGGHPPLDAPGVRGHGVVRLDVPAERALLQRLLTESTCFVMPSHSEACGIAYVEAAAAGLPSIGTIRGGSDYLIGDGGIVVDPADDEALLAAMRRLAEPATAERLGAAALARSERFTWRRVAERLLCALDGATAEPVAA